MDKVRVQLLDENTGAVLKEVDILTSADAVTFGDGQTFQQKLDAGLLKGDTGAQGPQGIQGPAGAPFVIAKTYSSISDMNAGYATDGLAQGSFVLIDTGNINDADNAKLYIKGANEYTYLTDLSGAPGIQGPQGIQGIQGPKGDTGEIGATGLQGQKGDNGDAGKSAYQIYVDNLAEGVTKLTESEWLASLKGDKGEQGIQGEKGDTGAQGPAGADGSFVKFGTDYASGTQVKLFLKTM